jgi:hypothetical protein
MRFGKVKHDFAEGVMLADGKDGFRFFKFNLAPKTYISF